MKLKQCNIKVFFAYGFSSLLFLCAEEKAVLTVCSAEISSKVFGDQKICAGDQI